MSHNKHIEDYIDYCKFEAGHRAETLKTNSNLLYRFAKFLSVKGVLINEVPEIIFLEYIDFLSKTSCDKTIGHNKSVISCFFRFLQRSGKLNSNFMPEHRKVSIKLHPVVSESDMRKMCSLIPSNTFESIRDRAFVELAYSCGLRVSEIIGLKIKDILSNGNLSINGKGGKQRIGIICRHAMYWLKRYIALKLDNGINSEYVFTNRVDKKINSNLVKKILDKASKRAGIKFPVTMHTIRRTFATHLFDGGMDISYIAKLMGHYSIQTTQYYILCSSKHIKRLYELHPRNNPKLCFNTVLENKPQSSLNHEIKPDPIKVKGYSVTLKDEFINSLPNKSAGLISLITTFYKAKAQDLFSKKKTFFSNCSITGNYNLIYSKFNPIITTTLKDLNLIRVCDICFDGYGKHYEMYEAILPPGVIIKRAIKEDYEYDRSRNV